MPSLPPNPLLPEPDKETLTWTRRWNELFGRLWTSMIYVVNALCKADTLANKLATPPIDEIFYYETNTKVLNIGTAGVWQHAGARRGSATITAGNTSVAVSFSPNEPSISYRLSLSTNFDNGGVWWTSKAVTGFTANIKNVAPVGGATIDWMLTRD